MKRLFMFLLLIISVASAVFSQDPNNATPEYSAAQQELITLSEQWMQALEEKDQTTLERFLTNDFYISAPGEFDKTERSEWLKNGLEMDWNNLSYHNFKVDIYGDTAVVTALLDFKVTTKRGIPISTNSQVTDIWIRQDGQWKVVARHLGAYSIGGHFRLAAGFAAGLAFCFLIWLLLRFRKRFAARRNLSAA